MDENVTIRRVGAADVDRCVEPLADVMIDCVAGGASIGFMWPLPRARALAFWRDVAEGVKRGARALLVAEAGAERIVGTAQLILALPDNQPHRADVAKVLVHRSARRHGVAARLMSAVDATARAEHRTLLVLDAVTGGDAERLYARTGWQRVGEIPRYALMPDGAPCATTYFYKEV